MNQIFFRNQQSILKEKPGDKKIESFEDLSKNFDFYNLDQKGYSNFVKDFSNEFLEREFKLGRIIKDPTGRLVVNTQTEDFIKSAIDRISKFKTRRPDDVSFLLLLYSDIFIKTENGLEKFLDIPKTKDHLLTGSEGFHDFLSLKGVSPKVEIVLPDGTKTNPLEISFLRACRKYNISRQKGDKLFYTNPETGKRERFFIKRIEDGSIKMKYFKEMFNIEKIKEILHNCFEEEIIKTTDFRLDNRDNFGLDEKSFENKKVFFGPKYASFTTIPGYSIRYYLGRNKIPGINIDWKPTIKLSRLDKNTAAFIDSSYGVNKIIATLDLFQDKYAIEKMFLTAKELGVKDPDANLVLNNDYTEKNIQSFDIKNILPQFVKENPLDHLDFLSQVTDVKNVINMTRSVLEKLNISVLEIPFKQQVLLFGSLSQIGKEDEVINLVKKFKINGLKTFLSLEHGGQEMGDKILELGKILEQHDAERVFTGYAQIIDQADSLKNRLENSLQDRDIVSLELKKKIPHQIYDALLLRAKDILIGAHMVATGTIEGKLDIDEVCNALAGITKMLHIINHLHTQDYYQFTKTLETPQNHKYHIIDSVTQHEYILKIFLRPYAEKNAQARANFELSFDTKNPDPILQKTFYNEIISHTQNKKISGSVLRIGIDREDYDGVGRVSLDIGRSERSDTELTRTGDILGNLLSYASIDGHHTTEPFSSEFGDPETFAQLVNLLGTSLIKQKQPN